jgi:hypothetical protein
MERLTIPDVRVDEHTTRRSVIDVLAVREHAMEFYFRLKAYEDMVDLETLNNTPISRLVELAEADKDGRVDVLPCKVGDGLWTFCSHPVEQVYSFTVTDISTLNGRTLLNTSRCGVMDARDVGKTVFLTREEAKKALQEMEGKA